MRYITGVHALNLPCSQLSCGDWYSVALQRRIILIAFRLKRRLCCAVWWNTRESPSLAML